MQSETPRNYKIIDRKSITNDTISLLFELEPDEQLSFFPGDHMHVHYDFDGEEITRPYTPTSTPDDRGFFELIVKRYPSGVVSSYLHSLAIGQTVYMSGPHVGGHFVDGMARKVGMVAGGVGITPMVSMIRTIIRRGLEVQVSLLYANKTEADIILRDEFENLAAGHDNFRLLLALDTVPPYWNGHRGYLDETALARFLPSPAADTVVFLCGPPMMEFKLREKLLLLGYGRKQIIIP